MRRRNVTIVSARPSSPRLHNEELSARPAQSYPSGISIRADHFGEELFLTISGKSWYFGRKGLWTTSCPFSSLMSKENFGSLLIS